jgi:hypothetical protein
MFLGHYALALAGKRIAPRLPLGTLVLAAQLLDELWPIFLLLGWEQVRIVSGYTAASPLEFVSYPISHSLLAAAIWAFALACGYYVFRRHARGAVVIGCLVVSHWFLDFAMHRPDLPLWPGSRLLFGAGLWNSVPATMWIEGLLFVAGIIVYVRTTRPRDATGVWAFWTMIAVLALIFIGSLAGPLPPGEQAVAWMTLGLWLFVPWGYWVDRHREAQRIHR